MDATQTDTLSKGDFARAIGVSAGRVSQYISDGKIYGKALHGHGRLARIRPEIAKAQLQKTLEPAQRFGGNGSAMRGNLFDVSPAAPTPVSDATPLRLPEPAVDDIAAERLKQMRIKTAQAEREEKLAIGQYMLAEDARREMGKAVGEAFKVMEQGLHDMASALAEKFALPQRDVHHALQHAFRGVRERAASGFRDRARAEPELLDVDENE